MKDQGIFIGRAAIVSVIGIALAFQVVRSAAVARFGEDRLDIVGQVWPGHPHVILAAAMAEIGRSAANGDVAAPPTLAMVRKAALRAPLAVEPFLVEGAVALSKGEPAQAERLFAEAKRRDPRSAAARFFLAQQYLATGRATEGLAEAGSLVRLVGGSNSLVPGLAEFARTPGAIPPLRRLFAANPKLESEVLNYLSRDARNAGLILALAGGPVSHEETVEAPSWQAPLLAGLIDRGDYLRARALWLRMAGLRAAPPGLFNPHFAKLTAPAPFNWTLLSGGFGVAEPFAPNGLQIIYYGRDNADLATQLLLLPPGNYELRMQVVRQANTEAPSGLLWSLSCRPGGTEILKLPIGSGTPERLSGRFAVPANCPAQELKLVGVAREFAASEQAVITDLELVRGAL